MPHAPSVKHLMKVLDGPAVSSANFYAFDHHTMSNDAEKISKINQKMRAVDGMPDAGAGDQRSDGGADAAGEGNIWPEKPSAVYEKGLPNMQTIHTEAPDHGIHEPQTDRESFDSLEFEKRDTVVMAKSVL